MNKFLKYIMSLAQAELEKNTAYAKAPKTQTEWRFKKGMLTGFYRTKRNQYAGAILYPSESLLTQYWIMDPPAGLLKSIHKYCFIEAKKDAFMVHWIKAPKSVTEGIRIIEDYLSEVEAQYGIS